jgi:ParB family transcriptional regulator, chromosome partitioning protein
MADKRPALGRGLSALIPDNPAVRADPVEVDIDLLSANREQPRERFDAERLAELTQSVRANGIIQPIVVRRKEDRYEIVAGERRWRAAQQAGLLKVPVVIRDVSDEKRLELALVENIQREDLNPIEEARAYRRLLDELHFTQDAIAEAVGKDRSSVANLLRLLRLPEELRADVAAGILSTGHARALLPLPDAAAQRRAARDIAARGLSVRETEALVRRWLEPPPAGPSAGRTSDVHTRAAEDRLRLALGTRVRIIRRRKGGRIEIEFGTEDELHRLYEQLVGSPGAVKATT